MWLRAGLIESVGGLGDLNHDAVDFDEIALAEEHDVSLPDIAELDVALVVVSPHPLHPGACPHRADLLTGALPPRHHRAPPF